MSQEHRVVASLKAEIAHLKRQSAEGAVVSAGGATASASSSGRPIYTEISSGAGSNDQAVLERNAAQAEA